MAETELDHDPATCEFCRTWTAGTQENAALFAHLEKVWNEPVDEKVIQFYGRI